MIVMQEEFLTVDELAERLRVREETVIRWIKGRKLLAYKVGGQWRISHTDFQKFMQEQKNKK